jgi:membrane-associated phospholipid phosphatase
MCWLPFQNKEGLQMNAFDLSVVRFFDRFSFSAPEFEHGFALGRAQRGLDAWTSFPSDHATLFAALATGLWFASRRAG